MLMEFVNLKNSAYDIYCGRSSIYENPFKIGVDGIRYDVCNKYKEYFYKKIVTDQKFKAAVLKLKGKRCACYCVPLQCHLETIKEWLDNHI